MQRERVADNIWVFTSSLFAQVTAGVVFTSEGAVVIDTLPYPSEAREMRDFARSRSLGSRGIRYAVLTHSHADHIYGAYLYPEAEVISHRRCRDLMRRHAEQGLRDAREHAPELNEVQIRLPGLVFQEEMTIRLGGRTIVLSESPGHSADVVSVFIKEDKVLFASDTVMPVPYIVGGDTHALIKSLEAIADLGLENIVQGHGEVLLRGEIVETVASNIAYLQKIDSLVRQYLRDKLPRQELQAIDIEACGKSRIPLSGLVQRFHQANLAYLYEVYRHGPPNTEQDQDNE